MTPAPRFGAAMRAARLLTWLFTALMLHGTPPAAAELLDRVDVSPTDAGYEVIIRVTEPIQILRSFPAQRGADIRIFLAPIRNLPKDIVSEQRDLPAVNGVPRFSVIFPDRDGSVLVKFDAPVQFKLRRGADQRSIVLTLPMPKGKRPTGTAPPRAAPTAPAEAPAAPTPPALPAAGAAPEAAPSPPPAEPSAAPAADIEAQAAQLMTQSRAALGAKNWEAAIDVLNRLLNLPPNTQSREAQALVGRAREGAGETRKAIAEYELYLKLYPDSPATASIRERVALLKAAPAEPAPVARDTKPQRPESGTQKTLFGSLSQFYYRGASKVDVSSKQTSVASSPSLSFTDQSALVTALDLTGRIRTPTADTRIVVRDAHTHSFLDSSPGRNRLYAAYLDHEDKQRNLGLRLGRQTPTVGGALERFDGGVARYRFTPGMGIFAIAGVPQESNFAASRHFYGAGIELGAPASSWSTSLYGVEQRVDGLVDRRALGAEARFGRNGTSLYSLMDYDIAFEALNLLMLQGSHQFGEADVLTFIVDHRKTPALQLTNALLGETTTSIDTLVAAGVSEDELRRRALGLTADATLLLLGLTHTVNSHWQVGVDYNLSRISGTEGSGLLPPAPGSGDVHTLALQGIHNGWPRDNDVLVVSGNYILGASYAGWSVAATEQMVLREKWRVEPALRYYRQDDDLDTVLHRITPSVRLSYRMRDRLALEGEAGLEWTRTDTTTAREVFQRHYVSVGFRWDFLWP